jgi:CheY-like chemotaxis protein
MLPPEDQQLYNPATSTATRILVVEDEVLIRMLVADELRDADYDVVEAGSADEALELLESLASVDLIISDVRMPGSIDGLGLLAAVKARCPRMPFIVTSGHIEPSLAIQKGADQFVSKPYSMHVVLSAVHDELSAGRSPL